MLSQSYVQDTNLANLEFNHRHCLELGSGNSVPGHVQRSGILYTSLWRGYGWWEEINWVDGHAEVMDGEYVWGNAAGSPVC